MNEVTLDDIFGGYREMKRQAVRDPDVDNDIPMLLYLGEGSMDDEQMQILCVVIPSGDKGDLCNALAACMARQFIPYWAAVCTDGYVAKATDFPDMVAGGLALMFDVGDDRVQECLTITATDNLGDMYADSVTYWYDDDGDLWFRDDQEAPVKGHSEGPLIDVLKDVCSLWGKTPAEVISTILERTPEVN